VPADQPYVFDNDDPHATEQHRCLVDMLDPLTNRQLSAIGVAPGWRCLEVGGGGGSTARWLSERVERSGEVVVTDIRPGRLVDGGNLRVRCHDIVRDNLEEDAFDLVHVRAVLFHLPQRDAVVRKLVRAVKPGGWLQIDDFDLSHWPGLQFADDHQQAVYERYRMALNALFEHAGAELGWGARISHSLWAEGLTEIDHDVEVPIWRAHTPGADLMYNHTFQLRDRLLLEGLTEDDLIDLRVVLRDSRYRGQGFGLHSAYGRRAG
jgi:SAM-dependent methyltransferase